MLRGATKVTIDAKGRLAIPTRYRERLALRCDGQLVATVDKDYCLLLYPLPDWEDIERKLMRLPSLDKHKIPVGSLCKYDEERWGKEPVRFVTFANDENHELGETPICTVHDEWSSVIRICQMRFGQQRLRPDFGRPVDDFGIAIER